MEKDEFIEEDDFLNYLKEELDYYEHALFEGNLNTCTYIAYSARYAELKEIRDTYAEYIAMDIDESKIC